MPRTLVFSVLAIALFLPVPTSSPAQEGTPPRLDRFGDPLPVGALTRLGTLRFHRCNCAAYSPDGKLLAATEGDEVFLWDIATTKKIRQLAVKNDRLTVGLIFSHDGKKLIDLYSGRILRKCKAEGTGFDNVAFSPNSKLVAASCFDTSILVWPADAKVDKPLDEKNLAQVLENGSAADAYAAIGRMIADPERAIPFLEQRLHAVANVDTEDVRSLIADLDDKKQPALSAEDVLHLRAIQALERIATKRVRQLLEKLAQGAETSPRTRAALEALRRMEAQ